MNRFSLSTGLKREWLLPTILLVAVAVAALWRGGKSLDATWLLTLVACVCTMFGRSLEKRRLPLWLWVSVLTWDALTVLSYVFSETGNYGFDEVLRTISLSLLLLWIARWSITFSERFVDNLSRVVSAIATASVAIGIAVYSLQPVSRFVGTFFDARFHTDYWPNAWGEWILAAWPLTLPWVMAARTRQGMLLRSCVPGLLLGGLALSFSRGSVIAFAGQLVLLLLLMIIGKLASRISLKKMASTVAFSVLIGASIFAGGNMLRSMLFPVESVESKVTFTASEGSSSINERAAFWNDAMRMTQERPVLGYGPYSFRFVQTQWQQGVLATSDHPHNLFLKMSAERGIPALVAFTIAVLGILVCACIAIVRQRGSKEALVMSLLLVSASGVVAHTMIDYNVQFVGVALLLWIALGLLASLGLTEKTKPSHGRISFEQLTAILLLAVATFEAMFLVTSSLGRRAEAQGDRDEALYWYEQSSLQLFPRDMELSRARLAAARDGERAGIAVLAEYQEQNRHDARAWLLRADMERALDELEAARESYRMAWQLGKYNLLEAGRGIMETSILLGDIDTVRPFVRDELVPMTHEYAEAILQNSHFIALGSTPATLLSITESIGRYYPAEAGDLRNLGRSAAFHAQQERSKLDARPPGLLW